MGNQDKRRYIRVAVENESVVCGIKKNSTCDDVIKMVMGTSVDERQYALFESSYGVEQRIDGHTKVLKQIENWGTDLYHYSLVIRQIDTEVESKIAATVSRSRTRLRSIRELLTKKKKKKYHRSNTTIINNLDRVDLTGSTDKRFEKNMRGFMSHSHLTNNRITRRTLSPVQLHRASEEDRTSRKHSHPTNNRIVRRTLSPVQLHRASESLSPVQLHRASEDFNPMHVHRASEGLSPLQLHRASEDDKKSGKLELLRRYMIDVKQFQVDEKGQRRRSMDISEVPSAYGTAIEV